MSIPGTTLFPRASTDLIRALEGFEAVLDAACPLRPKHRAALPGGIRRLSAQLTVERDGLPRDYMTRPDTLAAYLRWFLPWNLLRQGLLLEGLDLNLPEGAQITDLGCGPLTFPLALWAARPHLRERKLNYTGVDRAEPALRAGRDLCAALGIEPDGPWTLHTERALAGRSRQPRADLLVAANLLNEMELAGGRSPRRGAAADEAESFGDREQQLLGQWERMTTDRGAILLIEPGIRPAGRALTRIRQAALARGWQAAAPCPHQGDCPQPGVKGLPWCHFTFEPTAAPSWLRRLAGRVHLAKERASLSFLLLTRPDAAVEIRKPPRLERDEEHCLVVSEPFPVPPNRIGRYGCSGRGLALLEEPARGEPDPEPEPGRTLVVRWPDSPRRDAKSGALVLPRSEPPTAGGKRPPRR